MSARPEPALVRRLVNRTTGQTVAARAVVAQSAWAQMFGLIGRPATNDDAALGLPGCAVVHTAGMRYALDVAFCDAAGRVLQVSAAVPPWRITAARRHAAMAWETRAGILSSRVRPGDVLALEKG